MVCSRGDNTTRLAAEFSPDMKYRYTITRHWSDTHEPLVWIMLNPSIADASRDDPTIRRCMEFSINSGFGGCLILNLFAFRSTNPGGLLINKDPVGPDNDKHIAWWGSQRYKVVCAWGCLHEKLLWRPLQVLKMLEGANLNYIRLTKVHGEPGHPLYLPSKLRPKPMNHEEILGVYERRMSV
jgi:hypothetical protein